MIREEMIKWCVGFLCGAGASLLGTAMALWRKNRRENRAIRKGLQCILRQQIIDQHEKWVGRGYCPIYAKEALKRSYDSYHILGGNDVATDLYHETMELSTERSVRQEPWQTQRKETSVEETVISKAYQP